MARKVFNNGEILYAEDVNTIGQPFVDGQDLLGHGVKVDDNSLSDAQDQIKERFYTWYNRFRVSVTSGLNLSVNQGSFSVNGNIISLPPSTLVATNNATSFIWIGRTDIDTTVALRQSPTLPSTCIPLARVITSSGSVTSLTDLRDQSLDVLPPSIPDAVPVGNCIISLLPPSAPVPTGYIELLETPQNLSRTTYSNLFAAWGTHYGVGDGSTTFGVPGTGGRYIKLGAVNAVGSVGGDDQITIPFNSLPTHSHAIAAQTHSHTVNQSAHGHSVTQGLHNHGHEDFGHQHTLIGVIPYNGTGTRNWDLNSSQTDSVYTLNPAVSISNANINNLPALANVSVDPGFANISINPADANYGQTNNTGNGQSFTHVQPFIVFRVFIKV